MDVERFVEEFPTLFHLTNGEDYQGIKQEGLQPEMSPHYDVYFSGYRGHALNYEHRLDDRQYDEYVLISVPTRSLDPDHLEPDDVDLPEIAEDRGVDKPPEFLSPYKSMKWSGQIKYTAPIEPSLITVEDRDELRRTKRRTADDS